MTESYWTQRSISRRTALRGAMVAGGGLAALSLAGCGGGSSNKTASPQASSSAIDSTKGKPGGVFKFTTPQYPSVFSTYGAQTTYTVMGLVYSTLLAPAWGQESVGFFDYYNLEPDLAQAMPEQPDQTTLVFKLRSNAKFHNGRAVNAEDVKYTIDRITNADTSVYRAAYRDWVDKVEATDAQTLTIKSKFPYAEAQFALAGNQQGYVIAKEHEEGPTAATTMMGSGPFTFVSATSPVSISYRKNPDYYLKPYPYFDEVQVFSTRDPVKAVTDFTTRQIHQTWILNTDDRDQVKQQRPDARSQNWESWATGMIMRNDKAPFSDQRVRQALGMSLDRKKIRQVVSKGEGRDDQYFTLQYQKLFDFKEPKDLGASAKYWDFNPTEAKKLLAAAGIDKPIEGSMLHFDASVLGQAFVDIATLSIASWREQGVANLRDLVLTQPQTAQLVLSGQYESMALQPTTGFSAGPAGFSQQVKARLYWPAGSDRPPTNEGYVNDARLTALADKQIAQFKLEDRKQTYHEMESIMAEQQYRFALSTGAQAYYWDPSVQNVRLSIEQGSRRYAMRWWFA